MIGALVAVGITGPDQRPAGSAGIRTASTAAVRSRLPQEVGLGEAWTCSLDCSRSRRCSSSHSLASFRKRRSRRGWRSSSWQRTGRRSNFIAGFRQPARP